MNSLPKRHWTSIAVLAALLLALTGLVSPAAQAATARSLTLGVSPSAAYGGTQVTFRGHLSKSPTGTGVRIQRLVGSTWVHVRSTQTTAADGAYSTKVTLPTTAAVYTFRAAAPRTASLATAYSRAVRVTSLRPTTATITANPATVAVGAATQLSGTVAPFVAGTVVTLQRQRISDGVWVSAATTTVSPAGTFAKSVTPTTTTTSYRVAVPRAGVNGSAVSPTTTVTALPPPAITTTSLPNGAKGVAYTATLTKTGEAGTWSKSAGSLPAGITLNASTGELSGTPTAAGTFNFTATFTETDSGLAASKALSLAVTPAPTITTTSLPDATRATAYSATLTHTGGAGTWSITGLPEGLTYDAATGVISGTPSAPTGTYGVYPTFTETATGLQAFKPLALNVVGANVAITTTSLPDGTKGVPYSTTLTKTGAAGTWSSLELPAGLTLNASTGELAGTPTVSGEYAIYLAFTETVTGEVATKALALDIAPSPVVTTTSLPDGTTGTPYSQQLAVTGQAGGWTLTSGSLPPGVTLSSDGLISGTPTEPGDYGITVTYTETSTSYFDKQQLLLHVSAPGSPVIETTSLPAGTVGSPYSATLTATPAGGTWAVTFGSLPEGITLNSLTGELSGTPTAAGDSLFQITYADGATSNTKVLGIHVAPAPPG